MLVSVLVSRTSNAHTVHRTGVLLAESFCKRFSGLAGAVLCAVAMQSSNTRHTGCRMRCMAPHDGMPQEVPETKRKVAPAPSHNQGVPATFNPAFWTRPVVAANVQAQARPSVASDMRR